MITHHSPGRTVDYSFRARVVEDHATGVPAAGTAVHTRPVSASARAASHAVEEPEASALVPEVTRATMIQPPVARSDSPSGSTSRRTGGSPHPQPRTGRRLLPRPGTFARRVAGSWLSRQGPLSRSMLSTDAYKYLDSSSVPQPRATSTYRK